MNDLAAPSREAESPDQPPTGLRPDPAGDPTRDRPAARARWATDRDAARWGDGVLAAAGRRSTDRIGEAVSARDDDPLAGFRPAILAVRWATTGVSLALASSWIIAGDPVMLVLAALILAHAIFRTLVPVRDTGSLRAVMAIDMEVVLAVTAVITTGYWGSPLVLVLVNAVIVAGFARGYGFALRVAIVSIAALTLPALVNEHWSPAEWAEGARWATLLVSAGIVAGYGRRLAGEATRRHSIALDRVARLTDANALLTNLHRVAQTLPASLDEDEVLDSTSARLRALLPGTATMIVLRDEASGLLTVVRTSAGLQVGGLAWSAFPDGVVDALHLRRPILVTGLNESGPGLVPGMHSGIYAPLLARGLLVGVVAVETASAQGFSPADVQLLRGFVEPVALAIDNSHWFRRIQTVAADEERFRIARELHDRVGQSLAYLGFEVDRMIRRNETGQAVTDGLAELRQDIRQVVTEVRETLSDLRTDVTDTVDFAAAAEQFAARLAARSHLEVTVDCDTDHRLPILQERELWRIAQEALVNVERHAQATAVDLRWRCTEDQALLEVTDNGVGLPETADGTLGRPDSYGLIGMRERADSVGAVLELLSTPHEGTTVRCYLAQR
ncbi:MAG: GAF domain-containing sensor histidine kinase [Acidimicrobiales bacterium]